MYYINERKIIKMENTEEELKHFFPYLMNSISSSTDYIFPEATKNRKDQEVFIQPKMKNLTINIFENRSPSLNAYTIPMLQSPREFDNLRKRSALFHAILAKESLKNFNATGKNGIVTFNNPKKIQVCMWMTKGFIGSFSEEEKIAVALHEIGHWVEFEPLFNSTIFSHFAPSTFALLALIKARAGETRADKFAARVGYGDGLISTLNKFDNGVRTNISVLGKISDYLRVISSTSANKEDQIYQHNVHPNTQQRIDDIKNVEEQVKVLESLIKYDDILNEGLSEFLYGTFKLLISPLDKLVAKHAKLLFPLSK